MTSHLEGKKKRDRKRDRKEASKKEKKQACKRERGREEGRKKTACKMKGESNVCILHEIVNYKILQNIYQTSESNKV